MYRNIKRHAIYVMCILSFWVTPVLVGAGSHPLTKHELTSGTGFFDMAVSLDWNPTQSDKDGKLKTAFEQFARDVFMMSEGKNKIRKLYVFTNSAQMGNADIRFLDEGGRSNATINGIFNSGKRILTYTGFSNGNSRTGAYIGHTIAHEFGHYVYGVFDEYKGDKATAKSPSRPLSGDTPRDTIMCSHGKYQWLSISSDYEDEEERSTAQWRIYKSSAWDTLVRDPKNDKINEKYKLSNPRERYKEFENMIVPKELSKPSNGWDSNFQIVYMGDNVVVLVINKAGSMGTGTSPKIDAAKSAAKQFVDLMNIGDSVAVVTFDTAAFTLVNVTSLTNQAARDGVKAKISAISTGGDSNYSDGLSQAWSLLSAPALVNNTRYVVFLSDSGCDTGTCPPDVKSFADSSIPIHTIGLGNEKAKNQLSVISKATGGTYHEAPAAKDLANIYAAVIKKIDNLNTVVDEQSGTLATGGKNELQALMTGKESAAFFRANWDAGDTMNYELTDPSGNIIRPNSLPKNVTYLSDADYAMYTVITPPQGDWTGRVIAGVVTSGGYVSQQISSQSKITIDVQLTGGTYPEPIGIMVTLEGPEPIAGATVVASITPPQGAPPIADIQLIDTDNEDDVDSMAGDGIYSGILADYGADGTYTITIKAANPSGAAYLSTAGALESGDDEPVRFLPPFRMMATAAITVSGYAPIPNTPSGAAAVKADNTKTWGTIRNNGDVAWHAFAASAGTKYFIQTSNLVSTDGTPMATLVTLYQPDADTEIRSSSHYNGSNISFIEWVADVGGTYYITVEHASPGTGTFALTVGPVSLLQSAGTVGSGGGSSSSNCFIATAAFGSYLHPFVKILRLFRDRFLLTSRIGRSFVNWYYNVSPPIADTIRTNKTVKAWVRLMLLPAVGFSYLCVRVGPIPLLLVCVVFTGIICVGIESRRRK